MFTLGSSQQFYLYDGFCDMRKSFDGLCGLISSAIQPQATSGEVFVFLNRSRISNSLSTSTTEPLIKLNSSAMILNESSNFLCVYTKINYYLNLSPTNGSNSSYIVRSFRSDTSYIKLGTVDSFLSVDTLKEKITQKTEYGHVGYSSYFYETLVNFVVEQNFLVSMQFDNLIAKGKYFIDQKLSVFPRELQRFEPLLFLKFDNNAEKLNIAKK